MSIFFDEAKKTFYLESKNLSYVFDINEIGMLRQIYFGARVPRDDLHFGIDVGNHSCNVKYREKYTIEMIPTELSLFGYGDWHEVSLDAVRENGDSLFEFEYESYEIYDEKPELPGMPSFRDGKTLAVTLKDKSGISAILYYTVCEDAPVIIRRMRIVNESGTKLKLNRAYSFNLDFRSDSLEMIYFDGMWANERSHTNRIKITNGIHSIGSKSGMSSHRLNPFAIIAEESTCEDYGSAYGIMPIYSGSWEIKAELDCHRLTRLMGGINDFTFEWTLGSGESFDTPEVILGYSENGFGGLSRGLHDALRNHLINPNFAKKPRPAVINNWEATYFDFNEEKLKAIVSAIKGSGIDTLVLDDGWFGARYDDNAGLGDWVVNDKLNGTFDGIIGFLKENGMKFGLWFEPETVNPDSDLYRAHPDWAVWDERHEDARGRHEHLLDLTRSEVRDYVVASVSAILKKYDISYVKWDCNRNIATAYSHALESDRQKEFYHRYCLGLYDICQRLIYGFPDVLFEGCSGGGGRFDAGMLYYFPQIWTSDNTDACTRTFVQYNTSFSYPLSAMSCHVSICPNHQTGRTTAFSARAHIAHLGATGYELDTTKLSAEDIEAIASQIKEYRETEDLIINGDLYRLESPEKDRFAVELVSKDGDKATVTAMRYLNSAGNDYKKLYPKGLLPDATYSIPELSVTAKGETLMKFGILPYFDRHDFATVFYHINRIG